MKKLVSKKSLKLTFMFSFIVFFLLIITMFVTGFIVMLQFHLGFSAIQTRNGMILYLAIVSVIVGTILSNVIGKRVTASISAINEVTKEVARGNFSVTLDENIPVDEIRSMSHNFNLMTQELSKTEMFRSDFISNVSHEFKTPLSAIEGYATLLQSSTLSPEKRSAYITKIIYNVRRLSALTGNILQLSRLENQEIAAMKETFSLDEQLRQILLMFESEWTEKNLDLDIDLDPVDYYGNRELLSQVWQNLIGNALKFSRQGGFIRVTLKQEPHRISITVTDNGIGMTEETAQRIFEKFYQGDTSHATEGNGLGLTLAKRIVDLHEGTISVSGREGQGSSFTVLLPFHA